MPIYWIFIILAIIVTINSDMIDKKVNANGKLRLALILSCVFFVAILSFIIKIAL